MGTGKVAGRSTDIADCYVLVESEALPADRTPLYVHGVGVALVADV